MNEPAAKTKKPVYFSIMHIGEEETAFYHQIGRALSQWAYAENQLVRVVSLCVSHSDRDPLAVSFLSIENFRSKLQFCDSLITVKFAASRHLTYWATVAGLLRSASAKRNKLAHNLSVLYIDGDIGRRFALIPWLGEDNMPASTQPRAPAKGGKARPPPGSLCLRDLYAITEEFHVLTTALANVYELLSGRPAPFPTDFAPTSSPPTIASIARGMRAMFAPLPEPSQK